MLKKFVKMLRLIKKSAYVIYEWPHRKEEFETLASFHHTPDETEMEKENRLRDHHLIERANELKMEQMQEIKKLNQHIIQVSN